MATTSNYGWTTPDDTALVKDGASAIRSLGTAIDTSLNTALGTKKAGMVLLNTTSFSGVSSISAAADSFTATYANYRILLSVTSPSNGNIEGRLRAAGSDDSVATYNHSSFQHNAGNTSGIFAANTNLNRWIIAQTSATLTPASISMDLFNPKDSVRTSATAIVSGADTNFGGYFFHGVKAATTSFDSITFIFTGNSTGTLRLYGYNQ
jgi:hypothetical protein